MPDKLPALIASLALLIFSFAALAAATGPARAQDLGPAFSGGDFPKLSFSAQGVPLNAPPTVYTVPAGKKFVVHTFCHSPSQWYMVDSGTPTVWNSLTRLLTNYPPLYCTGDGNYVFDAGDVVAFGSSSTSASASGHYLIEGTLMAE